MNEFKWYYGEGREPEMYFGGCATKKEALDKALEMYGDEVPFVVCEANKAEINLSSVFDFDHIRNRIDETNEDCWGEDGMEFPDPPGAARRELEEELATVLRNWLEKHKCSPEVHLFDTVRNVEEFNMEKEEQ